MIPLCGGSEVKLLPLAKPGCPVTNLFDSDPNCQFRVMRAPVVYYYRRYEAVWWYECLPVSPKVLGSFSMREQFKDVLS